ncbi:MAG: xanthine dehydrogenase family protein subunit M [Bacillota bacterium]|nr:xanthine dehydrogenase family protein subunit M [Bacillota bacterium]
MKQFDYFSPQNIAEANKLLAELRDVRILAGGTDLVIHLMEGKAAPANIVDLSRLDELKEIKITDTEIIIGAMATFTQVIEHPILRAELCSLVEACTTVGSPQIRNQGTIGGNIVNASPAADSVPSLVAFGAEVSLISPQGNSKKKITDILVGVGKTNMQANELLTYIHIPRVKARRVSSFSKLARRNALAIARMSMAAAIKVNPANEVLEAGISLGAVAPNPFRVVQVEDYLIGKNLNLEVTETAIKMIADIVREKLGSRASAIYKNEAVNGVARDTFNKLVHKLEGGQN